MDELKNIAFQICITVLSFGLIRSILPESKYEKYMRLILNLIFMVLIINGIKNLTLNHSWFIPNNVPQIEETNIETNLKEAIRTYINDELNQKNFKAVCESVEIEKNEDQYKLTLIEISVKEDKEAVVKFIGEITQLGEEQIYVSDG